MKKVLLGVAVVAAFGMVSCGGPGVCDCVKLDEERREAEDRDKWEEENKDDYEACEKMIKEAQEDEEKFKKLREEAEECEK